MFKRTRSLSNAICNTHKSLSVATKIRELDAGSVNFLLVRLPMLMILLLAPSASAMRAMLSVCDQFGSQYSVKFNATKSKSMQFVARGRVKRHLASRPDFCISGHSIEYVDKYVHLGHVISSDLSDN